MAPNVGAGLVPARNERTKNNRRSELSGGFYFFWMAVIKLSDCLFRVQIPQDQNNGSNQKKRCIWSQLCGVEEPNYNTQKDPCHQVFVKSHLPHPFHGNTSLILLYYPPHKLAGHPLPAD